jgi:hypothetical protein
VLRTGLSRAGLQQRRPRRFGQPVATGATQHGRLGFWDRRKFWSDGRAAADYVKRHTRSGLPPRARAQKNALYFHSVESPEQPTWEDPEHADHSTRETFGLIVSDKVEGTNVCRSDGERIGEIERVTIAAGKTTGSELTNGCMS